MSVGTPGAIQSPPASAGVLGQGIKYPLALDSKGRLALSWGLDSVNDSIKAIGMTQPHERVMQPGFGAGVGVGEVSPDTDRQKLAMLRNIDQHEPRVQDAEVDVQVLPNGGIIENVKYLVRGEATSRDLTFPLYTPPSVTKASE